jgi:hypothetical protein
MFIDLYIYKVLRSEGAKCMVRRTRLSLHCAPLERQTLRHTEVYKHLPPTEPERLLRLRSLRLLFPQQRRVQVKLSHGNHFDL